MSEEFISSGYPSIVDVYPDRSTYRPGESASVLVTIAGGYERLEGTLALVLMHLDETVLSLEQSVELAANSTSTFAFEVTPPTVPLRGYGLDAALYDKAGNVLVRGSGALDVLERWSQAPRYGFLSDFAPEQAESVSVRCASLVRYHLNVVQFYDWMWRHYRLMPPDEEFTDALGRKLSLRTVRAAIEAVQSSGGAAMAYGAVYGAEPEYADQHEELRLYDEAGRPISLAELFYIMNIAPGSPWVDLIVSEFAEAVREMGFDGIHLDQYGFPKTAYSASGEHVDLSRCFPSLIDRSRAAVVAERPGAGVIFNAVENWPIETVAPTSQDAVYIEVWPPYVTYNDLRELIRRGKELGGGKQVILAAYLSPFAEASEDTLTEAEAATLLATAVILASGGFHLLLGERDGVLCDPYYPKYATMRPAFASTMKQYYDFLVRYEELLIAPGMRDLDQGELAAMQAPSAVALAGYDASPVAEPGKVWAFSRGTTEAAPGCRIFHLINLLDQATVTWNALRTPPEPVENVDVQLNYMPALKRIMFVAPDQPLPVLLPWVRDRDVVRLRVPRLSVWAMLVCELDSER